MFFFEQVKTKDNLTVPHVSFKMLKFIFRQIFMRF